MMQSLPASSNAPGVLALGEKSNISARLHERRFKDKTVSVFPRSSNVSHRFMENVIVAKLHRPVQVSWSAHILATPLFGATIFFKNSDRWKRFVASPSRENLGTASNSQDPSRPSKEIISRSSPQAENQVEAHMRKNSLETNHIVFTNEHLLNSAERTDLIHVSDNLVTKPVTEDDPDPDDRRESGEESSDAENKIQADSDRGGVGENELTRGNGDDISSGRKRMGRSRSRKKKANSAGIATYDSQMDTVQLKGPATETPEIKQPRQRNPRLSKRSPNEQEIQGAGVISKANVGQGIGGALRFNFGSRTTRKSLGVEDAARLSRLLGLEDTDRNEQPSPKLATKDDAYREQFGDGEVLPRTVESYKTDPSQETVADGPEVPLEREPVKKSPAAEKASKTEVPDQPSKSGKLEGVDAQAATSNEVEDVNENSQTSELVESKVIVEVADAFSEPAIEQVGVIIDQVTAQIDEQVQQVRINALVATESVASTASQVVDSISSTATQVTESVTSTAAKLSSSLNQILKDGIDSEDEFEESNGSDRPEFRGLSGLRNFIVVQEDQGILSKLRDFYFFMMKKPLPEFAMGMMAVPIALSLVFTLLYLPEFQGLAYDETARDFLNPSTGMGGATGLEVSWATIFQVFMFSLSLSTGLEPDLAPLSPYTLVVANINALFAQLILAFLSAAVFARLSQPSEPVRCSRVALICAHNKRRGRSGEALDRVLLTRCVLAGPQPCELVNVKVDLTYRFNTVSNEGSFFRGSYPLKLVRSQIALLDQGMLVRHIIDENSPLHTRTPEMLHEDDAIFVLSVAGLERSSMQPIFHVQYYSVCDEQVVWNAEFEDMILLNKKNQRVVDHSKLSSWKPL